jgi:predicted permease
MVSLAQDLRVSLRKLIQHPALTAISVVALGLGIGLTATMFSIVYGGLYRGLPFDEPHRLMHLERNNVEAGIESMEVTVHDYYDWAAQQTTFSDLAAFYTGTANLSGTEGRPERYDGAFMTDHAFRTLRAGALLGRGLQEGDDDPGAAPVVVLGYDVWQNRFNGDPDVVGRTVRLNAQPTTVVGVMPEGFLFPIRERLWMPMNQDPNAIRRGDGYSLEVFGRLKDGVSLDQASAELSTIAARLAAEYPETNRGVNAVIKPFTEEYVGEEPATLLHTMLAAVFLVLLIACANVANLLLGRAVQRSKEVAIRSSLGATRTRIAVQFLNETLVLAGAGAVLGLGIAWLGIRLFNNAIAPTNPPFWIRIALDGPALVFVVGLTLLATLLAGVLPALRASGGNVNEVLKDESRGSSSLRLGRVSRALVVAEIALSCGLLVAAGLMVKSVIQLRTFDYGFDTGVFTARVALFEGDYPSPESRRQFYDELLAGLGGIGGVEAAGLGTVLPVLGSNGSLVAIEGRTYATELDHPGVRFGSISPGYFAAFGVTVAQGRDFGPEDRTGAVPVAIVNQSFASRHFGADSPLGRRIRLSPLDTASVWRTVVGVVPDLLMDGIENEAPEGVYLPLSQDDARFMSLVLRPAGGHAMSLTAAVREAVNRLDPDMPIYFVDTLLGRVDQETWFYRIFGALFMVFGVAALFLGAVGLYGVMSFAVSRRTQEIGIRMALGAKQPDVLRMVLRQGVLQIGIGLAIGVVIAGLLGQGLRIVLFEVEPLDPVMFALITALLFLVGMLASYIPARRASVVNPVEALRYE